MYGLNPFARPRSSYERPVPLVFVNPADDPDTSVCFRHEWKPYILGALQQLMLQTTWKTDDPIVLTEQLQRANMLLALFAEGCPMPVPEGVEFDGEELMASLCEALRFQDGKLQAFCCGQWQDIPGQPAQGIGGPGQPGSGETPPTPGTCKTYQVKFTARDQLVLPFLVNAGDQLSFSNARGAGQDGSIGYHWNCPNGQIFWGGACVGGAVFEGTDFDPTIEHMRLIAIINLQAYPADQGVITVPGGVSSAQVILQVNDGTLTDNSGDYTLDVEFCNNAEATFTHVFDFTATDGGFVNNTYSGGVDNAVWVPGSGWESISCVNLLGGGGIYTLIGIHRLIAARTITSFIWEYDAVLGAVGTDTTRMDLLQSGTPNIVLNIAPRNGTGLVDTWAGSIAAVTSVAVDPILALASGSCDSAAHVRLYRLTVSGFGTDPF